MEIEKKMIYGLKKTKCVIINTAKEPEELIVEDSDSDTIKDVIKKRLHMWQVNCSYKRDNTDTKCPLCKKSEDATEHVLECEKAEKFTLSKENRKGEWVKIIKIYRKNKKREDCSN